MSGIWFPREPYSQQRDLAEAVVESARQNRPLVVESPTGTGKTLSLLAGALAWLHSQDADENAAEPRSNTEDMPVWLQQQVASKRSSSATTVISNRSLVKRHRRTVAMDSDKKSLVAQWIDDLGESVPKVLYASRTHSQLNQACQALHAFRPQYPEVEATVLASRQHLCLHPPVLRASHSAEVMNERCHDAQQADSPTRCPFFDLGHLQAALLSNDHPAGVGRAMTDIEDLVNAGKRHQCCPYYLAKARQRRSSVLFVPYPSLLVPSIRSSLNLYLTDALVIIDEAHNLPDAINGLNSCRVPKGMLMEFVGERLPLYLNRYQRRLHPRNLQRIQQILQLCHRIVDLSEGIHDPPMDSAPSDTASVDYLELAAFAAEHRLALKAGLDGLSTALPILLASFIVGNGRFLVDDGEIRYLSLDASECLESLTYATQRFVLAGGTMAGGGLDGLRDFARLLFSPPLSEQVDIRQYGHLIDASKQLRIVACPAGPTNVALRFTWEHREDLQMREELWRLLRNVRTAVPRGGLVVFVASYEWLRILVEGRMPDGRLEPVIVEDADKACDAFERFSAAIDKSSDRRATLVAVVGGRLSEGINFADDLARAVVIVGMPYANVKDRDVALRAGFVQARLRLPTLQHALQRQCMQTVNQALGRAIRHAADHAVCILADERYAHVRDLLPSWMRGSFVAAATYGEAHRSIVTFCKSIGS